ncbi:MAG: sulfatase-like hydrolase/transferase, partial [Chloroflexota bacterium]|nr:sulfatase-like hydrolase/transferase [Chloroflexota bacterium]
MMTNWRGTGDRPLNVLWLMSDQHSVRALGCYGNPVVRTPRLDRLAIEGTTFERAYCSYPVCVPARFTMLTGRYPHHTGCTGNTTPLPLRERTAAHHFAQAGYATAFLGKLHPVDGQTHGFDYYMDFGHYYDYLGPKTAVFTAGMGAEDSGCGSPWITIFRGEGPHRSPWVAPDLPAHNDTLAVHELLAEEDHFESFVARETIRVLETYRDEPLFVVASFLKPHNPFAPPAEYAALYRPQDLPLPQWPPEHPASLPPQIRGRTAPGAGTPEGDAWARRFLAAYYGNVSHMDACAGRILDALERLGLAENTLVLYTTDHGEMGYEHGLRGKFNFFEPSARIPLLARLPGRIPAGSRTQSLVDQADFVPTLLEVCGVPPASRSQPVDGASFAPALARPEAPGKAFAFGEYDLPRSPFYMRRGARWKYVRYTAPAADATAQDDGVGPARPIEELYDPQADPGELHN